MTMADATAEFFERMQTRGHEPLLDNISGTVRLELENGKELERWFVTVDKGDVEVSHRNLKADCTVRTHKTHFDQLVKGEANAMASLLRGTLAIDGNYELLVRFQRLFPSPHGEAGLKEAR
jgi:putative sterol carrier protein